MKGQISSAPEDAVVRQPETSKLTGYCDMQLRRMEQAGTFPRRFKLNPAGGPYGAVGWSRAEIMNWIVERRAAWQTAQYYADIQRPRRGEAA